MNVDRRLGYFQYFLRFPVSNALSEIDYEIDGNCFQ